MWCLSIKWTNSPSLKRPIDGDDGGYGKKCFLAWATASASTPAKTVVNFAGFLSPFKDSLGDIYLVSRAWIPQTAKKNASSFSQKAEETIVAFVMKGEEKRFFIPDNDTKNNIWFTLDLQEARHKLGITKNDFYLMQIGSSNLPEGALPLTSTYLNVIRNDHLEYAITWYSLAALLCIIYFLYNKQYKS